MSKQIRGLGKGVSAILGGADVSSSQPTPIGYINKEIASPLSRTDASDIFRVPVDQIEANPYQPRMSFDQDALEELASSIRSLGLIQPITVRRISAQRYQIISGERRFRASRMAGLTMVPAYVRDTTDHGMLEMAIVENVQRENLDPIETALSYRRLIDECSLTQDEMADRIGKKRSSVTNCLRLLKLPAKIQYDLKMGLISVGHAKVILSVEDEAVQTKLCEMVIADSLNVRQLEAVVRKIAAGARLTSPVKKQTPEIPESYSRLSSCFGKFFKQDIRVRRNASGKGTLTIKFESDSEIESLLSALEKAD